jgi:hypothetical protein
MKMHRHALGVVCVYLSLRGRLGIDEVTRSTQAIGVLSVSLDCMTRSHCDLSYKRRKRFQGGLNTTCEI